MTKAQLIDGVASGFVDPMAIGPLPMWRAGNGRAARPIRGRKLVEAAKYAASGTLAFSRKSLCRLSFRRDQCRWFGLGATVRLGFSV
jgi:hypothetical protein